MNWNDENGAREPAEPVAGGPPPLPSALPPALPRAGHQGEADGVWRGSRGDSRGCLIGIAAMAGLLLVTIIMMVFLLPRLATKMDSAMTRGCVRKLEAVGAVLERYARENDGRMPPMTVENGYFSFPPELLSDLPLDCLQCPGEPTDYSEDSDGVRYFDSDYVYLGIALRDAAAVGALLQRVSDHNGDWAATLLDLEANPDSTLPFMSSHLADPATVPLMLEWPEFHDEVVNVLFLDGHVESIPYGEKYPADDGFFDGIVEISDIVSERSEPEEDEAP